VTFYTVLSSPQIIASMARLKCLIFLDLKHKTKKVFDRSMTGVEMEHIP